MNVLILVITSYKTKGNKRIACDSADSQWWLQKARKTTKTRLQVNDFTHHHHQWCMSPLG